MSGSSRHHFLVRGAGRRPADDSAEGPCEEKADARGKDSDDDINEEHEYGRAEARIKEPERTEEKPEHGGEHRAFGYLNDDNLLLRNVGHGGDE